MIYFISDLHFGHERILEFERTQFKTIEEHDNYIIQEYNKVVEEKDTCYILGDLGFGVKKAHIKECLDQLHGTKIIILGNHDEMKKSFFSTLNGDVQYYDHPIYLNKRIVLSHVPVKVDDDVINVHGHLHNAVLDLPNYINVNAHIIKYKPLSFREVMDKVSTMKKNSIKFGEEWYKDSYKVLNPSLPR